MDPRALRLDWLRSFARFADCLNFTRTAEALFISQPALHTQVRRLAETVGSPLYVREGRALRLTPVGERVATMAREITRHLEACGADLDGAPPPPVVVSAGRSTHLYLLAGPLRAWAADGHGLRLRTESAAGCVEAVASAHADVGVAPLAAAVPELDAVPWAQVQLTVVLPDTHPLASADTLALADLEGVPMVLPPVGGPIRALINRPLDVAVEVDGWELMLHYVSLGVGAAIVNAFVPIPDGTRRIPLTGVAATTFHLIRRRGGMVHAAADALFRFLEAHPCPA